MSADSLNFPKFVEKKRDLVIYAKALRSTVWIQHVCFPTPKALPKKYNEIKFQQLPSNKSQQPSLFRDVLTSVLYSSTDLRV